jgi:hypothetical protein
MFADSTGESFKSKSRESRDKLNAWTIIFARSNWMASEGGEMTVDR